MSTSNVSQENFHKVTEGMNSGVLTRANAIALLSPRLLKREPDLLKKLDPPCSWSWFSARARTVVFLFVGPSHKIVSIGWSQCSPTDPYNRVTGVTIALIRALRDVWLPKEKKS